MRGIKLTLPSVTVMTASVFNSLALAEPGHDTWMDIKKNKEGWSIGVTLWDYVGVVLIVLVLAFALVVVVGLLKGVSPLKLLQSIGDNGFRVFAPRSQKKK
jgi:hypothetical protein